MQLTKLEIKGFKSFGDKVVIHFDKGITGIVGPNGCGKSNIVDAIRWVLGEQKTSALRSEKMENIIFNGTKNRKALQLAEVSLTFKNTKNLIPTEYNEVTITRRYYRSGESEYLLNDVSCRLKDITNLFLDTGIGADSYAIIELKMVDNILNDKDNSRRTLFEEAAGISKFKVRKKETLNKLKGTDKDLERVEDVLFEIEKNLKSLEKQAKQAENYHSLKTQYKDFSIQLAKITLDKHLIKIESIKSKIDVESTKKIELNAKINALNASIEKLKTDLLLNEHLVSSRQKTLNEHVNKTRQYESDKKIKNERLRYLNERNNNLNDQLATDKVSTDELHKELKKLIDLKADLIKTVVDLENVLLDLQKEQESQKEKQTLLKTQLNEVLQIEKRTQDNFYQLKKSIEISEIQLKNLQEELYKTKDASSSYTENVLELEINQNAILEKIKDGSIALEKSKNNETNLLTTIEQAENNIIKTKDQLAVLNRELDAKQNEFNLTKSLVDNLEGFPAAIKFLKKSSSWNSNSPLVSDVLTCPEEYRIAIENYLEPWMNYYVVENVANAYSAVSLLKESAKGKANFFVLDQLDTKINEIEPLKTHCKKAIDIVEFEDRFKNLVYHLLGNVYVVENASENIPEELDVVFLRKDGSLTKRKESISGGSVGLFEGKRIGRAKNLDKLEKEINKLNDLKSKKQHEVEKLNNDLNQLKGSSKKTEIESLSKELNKLNEEYISIKLKIEQFIDFVSSNSSKKDDLNKNIVILKDGIDKSLPKLNLIKVELEGLSNELKEKEQLIEIEELKYLQITNFYNQENIKTHQIRNKLEATEREWNFKSENLKTTQTRITKNNLEIEKTNLEVKQIIDKEEVSDDQLIELYQEKESIEKGVNEAEKDYYATRNSIDTFEKEAKSNVNHKDGIDNLLLELNTNLNEVKLTINSIKERLSVEFRVDLNQLSMEEAQEPKESLTESALNERVLEFRSKIDRLGPINPMAMEAYNEIKERYDFIIVQKEDLVNAKKSLLNTISEIDVVARANFEKAFDEINLNFQKVFRSLFTDEDTCQLTLVDPSNPLDSDIDIIARPKGKKPLSINQLSGGEKTLTAVALLFSIYLIKPAPFCIFDEVDAPLDDANIDKFNNIIREFSKESQFILVTHNKRTMSTTDIMYGVTMQESGVSKLVPVDLRSFSDENLVKN